MQRPVTRYAKTADGVHVAYQVLGDGPVDLVYVPGFVSHLEYSWEEPSLVRFAQGLASFARVIVFDKRGTGMSDRAVGVPTIEQRMDDVRAVMDAVDCERAAVMGVSEGAPMAAVFAATYPERTNALVLYGGMAKWVASEDHPWGLPPQVLDLMSEQAAEVFGMGPPLHMFAPSVADDPSLARWWAEHERLASSPGTARDLIAMNREIDIRAVLPTITVPTLVLHRGNDIVVRVEQGRYLADAIPGAKYVELPGNDHIPFYGDARAIVEEVEEFLTGARRPAVTDRVLATVLFTDIVGSTEQAARLGDEQWRRRLEHHDRIVRRQLERFAGREVKTTGDGFLATFDGPGRAVRCALAVCSDLAEAGIEVRTGLHTGEIELRGDDIAGVAVHVAQRVQGLAGPGEVVVSSTVKDLVAGSGLTFADRGTHALKGVADEWRLFTATGDSTV